MMHDHHEQGLVERQRLHFDRISDRYEQGRREKNHILLKQLIWRDALEGVADELPRSIAVLEAMCGAGEGIDILRAHMDRDFSYEGFDYSEAMVAQARRAHADAVIWQADATVFEPRQAAYDVIILIGGLHHIPRSAEGCVKRLAGGLRPGGFLINFEPTSGNPLFTMVRQAIYRGNDIFDEATESGFPVGRLIEMFENAGLEKRRVFFPGLLAYVLYYNPYAFPLLNIGGEKCVRGLYRLDRLFMHTPIGRIFSFATLSIWRKKQ